MDLSSVEETIEAKILEECQKEYALNAFYTTLTFLASVPETEYFKVVASTEYGHQAIEFFQQAEGLLQYCIKL